ncbi:MAG: LysR family transcriptional regulator [Pseudomonadota bacterium]
MNLASVDLNLLTAFDALTAERHVDRAAARIGIGQPAMSKRLAALRGLLRDDLFTRTRTGMRPTERALELAEPVRAALATLESALGGHRAFRPERAERTFRVSMTDHIAATLLPPLMMELSRVAPGVTLSVRFENRLAVAEALTDGDLDLAMTILPDAPPAIRAADLFEESFVCLVSRQHPEIREEMTLDLYLRYPHLLVTMAGDTWGFVDRLLAEQGLRRRVALALPYNLVAPEVVAQTEMIVTLAKRVAERFTMAEVKALAAPVPWQPYRETMLWHRRNDGDPGLAWLRRLVSDVSQAV